MVKSTRQLNIPPMEVEPRGSRMPSPANSVGNVSTTAANLVGIDLASLVLRAGDRSGMQRKQLADMYGMPEADFSAAFSPNRLDRNKPMKQVLPLAFARELALVMCEATGLAVAGPDAERHALADLLAACAAYIRVVQR